MMATAKPKTQHHGQPAPFRSLRRKLLWLALAVLALLIWFWTPITSQAVTGASYGARIACSCRYIAGRSLTDCRKDFEPGMGLVMLSEDAEEKSVTASVPLLSSQTATFREGFGCVLEKWED